MAHSQNPAGAPKPTPQQLNRISSQLRDLNAAYKAAVAAQQKPQGGVATSKKSEQ
jgi:hypothetical protein